MRRIIWLCCRKVCPSQLFIPLKKYSHQFSVQGNIEDMNHMLRGGGQALVAARDSDNEGNFPFIERLFGSENFVNFKRSSLCLWSQGAMNALGRFLRTVQM